MKKNLVILFVLFFLTPSFGQKKIEIPDSDVVHSFIKRLPGNLNTFNLKDLRTSTDSINIRIWRTHEIFTLNYNNAISSDYKIHTTNDKPIISTSSFSEEISKQILETLLSNKITKLQNENYRGIDGSYVFFEIATKNNYRVVSFWSPDVKRSDDCNAVVNILKTLRKTINTKKLKNQFLNSLPAGGYRWGMSGIHIDRFLDKDAIKTDFYIQAEKKIKTALNITEETNHWEYPLILINNKPAMIADLNKYTQQEVSKLEILKPDNKLAVLYGTKSSNGVVKVEMK